MPDNLTVAPLRYILWQQDSRSLLQHASNSGVSQIAVGGQVFLHEDWPVGVKRNSGTYCTKPVLKGLAIQLVTFFSTTQEIAFRQTQNSTTLS